MELGESLASRGDTKPDDTDVIEGGKDPETLKLSVEWIEIRAFDGSLNRINDCGEIVVVFSEKFHRNMGLLGVSYPDAWEILERPLHLHDRVFEAVKIDADEKSHADRYGVGLHKFRFPHPGGCARNPYPHSWTTGWHMPTEDPDDGHEFSSGQGFDDPHEGFDLDPPALNVDPDMVDPVDTRVVADTLDSQQIPSDAVAAEELLDVALGYMRINRHEQATDTLERAARFADDDHLEQEAWVNKGAAHAELQEFQQAIDAYREALRIDDESEHAASAETNLAFALWESGRSEQALEHAERAVELDPRFPQAWYNRGFFLLERGLAEDAVTAFDNALRLGYRNADILEEKARALEALGEDEQAEAVIEEAEELRQRAEEELVEER